MSKKKHKKHKKHNPKQNQQNKNVPPQKKADQLSETENLTPTDRPTEEAVLKTPSPDIEVTEKNKAAPVLNKIKSFWVENILSRDNKLLYLSLIIAVTVLVVLSVVLIVRSSKDGDTEKNNDVPVFLDTPETFAETDPPAADETEKIHTAETLSPPESAVSVPEEPTIPTEFCLDVDNIMQMPSLPNGCEVVSLSIVLNYLGYRIDPMTLYSNYMPRSDIRKGDPWTTYVGNAVGEGYGCYAPCIVETGNSYIRSADGRHTVKDVSYKKLEEYENYIREGKPVIMWGMLDMTWNPAMAWVAYIDGEEVVWHSYSHCMVLIGYTETDYIFCDPLVGIVAYEKYQVLDCFTAMFKQACVIEPNTEIPSETIPLETLLITPDAFTAPEKELYETDYYPETEPEEVFEDIPEEIYEETEYTEPEFDPEDAL